MIDQISIISGLIEKVLLEKPTDIERMVIGICNDVYKVTTPIRKVIVRTNEWPSQLEGVGKHIELFKSLDIKVPELLASDYSKKEFPVAYQILSYIEGSDLGQVIETMTDEQLKELAKEVAAIFKKLSTLPTNGKFGWVGKDESKLVDSWSEIMRQTEVEKRNKETGVVGDELVQKEKDLYQKYKTYFDSVKSTFYFDDIASKNVLIENGKFVGLIDLNEVAYGDPLEAIGSIKASWYGTHYGNAYTKSVEDALGLTSEQRRMVTVYALFNQILWLSENGVQFNKNTSAKIDDDLAERYRKIIRGLFTELDSSPEGKYSYKDRKFAIVPYDASWPDLFDEYASKIKKIFGDLQIEHIGSTAVPGMDGKPCIDVLVLVDELKVVEAHISEMEQDGFEYVGEFVMKDSRLFRVMKGNELLANIHFFPVTHPHNKEMLDLRDYLRTHPEEVTAYSKMKNDLYSRFSDDYASYRKNKDEYMNNLKGRIKQNLP